MEKNKLSHIDESGNPKMVDVSDKMHSVRIAVAGGIIAFPSEVFDELNKNNFIGNKGSIIQTAIIGAVQAVKKTSELIPFCHPLPIDGVEIEINPLNNSLEIICEVKTEGKTGVEMEALTGVSSAALIIYDMCKALSHEIEISNIHLIKKTGGKRDYEKGT